VVKDRSTLNRTESSKIDDNLIKTLLVQVSRYLVVERTRVDMLHGNRADSVVTSPCGIKPIASSRWVAAKTTYSLFKS
jgi:hypothetical protein